MLKGVNRITLILGVALMLGMATGCGDSKEKQAATTMLEQARASMEAGRYGEALELLDSLQVIFPAQTQVRRMAMTLRPEVIEKATGKELEQCDSLIAAATSAFETAKQKMVWIENPQLVEGYWVAECAPKGNFMDATGVQARVDGNGDFYLISEVNGAGNLHHSSITLRNSEGESASSGYVPYDDELNYRINGSETVTYSAAKSDEIGMFALDNAGHELTLIFNGENGKTRQMKLKAKDTDAIADAYAMAKAQKEGKQLMASRTLLEQKLNLAREQQKRLAADDAQN